MNDDQQQLDIVCGIESEIAYCLISWVIWSAIRNTFVWCVEGGRVGMTCWGGMRMGVI